MHDFPDYPCPICSPEEFNKYKNSMSKEHELNKEWLKGNIKNPIVKTKKNECLIHCNGILDHKCEFECKNCCKCDKDLTITFPTQEPMEWESELEKIRVDWQLKHPNFNSGYIANWWLSKLRTQIKQAEERGFCKGQEEYKQFILNILDGVDEADKQMGNTGGGTKAIRFALSSRLINQNNE
jgi:hypothetical protein